MRIAVNGEQRTVADGLTLQGLVADLGLAGRPCAAEVNNEVVPKRDHADRLLQEGDRVELVTLVGGG